MNSGLSESRVGEVSGAAMGWCAVAVSVAVGLFVHVGSVRTLKPICRVQQTADLLFIVTFSYCSLCYWSVPQLYYL